MNPDWRELLKLATPIVGQLAARGGGADFAFQQAFQQGAALAEQERRQKMLEEQKKREYARSYALEAFQKLSSIHDPAQFAELQRVFSQHAPDDRSREEVSGFSLPQSRIAEARLKIVTDHLARLENRGYDLDQLAESGGTIELSDGSRLPIADALTMTRARPTDATGAAIPAPKKNTRAYTPVDAVVDGKRRPINYDPDTGKYYDPDTGDVIPSAKVTRYERPPATTVGTSETERAAQLLKQRDDARAAGNEALASIYELEYQRLLKVKKELGQADDRPRVTVQTSGNLPPATTRRANQLADKFQAHPTVKRANTMSEAVSFVNGLDVNTKNPADDQALIYAFAKAMDPESVVREGEYATVQKYAQSWLEKFGFDARRVLSSNVPILTPQARQNLKTTITARFGSTKAQYDAIRRQFATQINRTTGKDDGEDWLIDALGESSASAQQPGRKKIGRFDVEVQ